MRIAYVTMVLCLAAIIAGAAFAGQGRAGKRQNRQEKRIEQGVESGQLNEREAKRLEKHQDQIENYEQKSLADDGQLDKKEKHHLEKMQDKQSHAIARQKHDRQGKRHR